MEANFNEVKGVLKRIHIPFDGSKCVEKMCLISMYTLCFEIMCFMCFIRSMHLEF